MGGDGARPASATSAEQGSGERAGRARGGDGPAGRRRGPAGRAADVVPRPPATPDPRRLRHVLGQVPTSLAVVTTMNGPDPAGSTVGSFVSVSLDPPLVAWFAMRSSSTLGAVRDHGAFSVNVLAADQADLGEVFARRSVDRFRGVRWWVGASGTPHLDGALVVLDCDVDAMVTLGDHEMVVGRVTSAIVPRPGVEPLVFVRGRFPVQPRLRPVGLDEVAHPA